MHAAYIQKSNALCLHCQRPLQHVLTYDSAPCFIACIIHDIKVNIEIEITLTDLNTKYRPCGIVYYANFHFVCRVIDNSGDIWFYGGAKHGSEVSYFGNIINLNIKKPQTVGDYTMCLLIYTKLINRDGS